MIPARTPEEYAIHSVTAVERQLAENIAAATDTARAAGMPDHALRQPLLDAAVAITADRLGPAVMLAAVRAERRRRKAVSP